MLPLAKHELATGKVLRMGGPPVDNVAIDEEGQITLVRLIGFSIVLGLGSGIPLFSQRHCHADGFPRGRHQRRGQPGDRLVERQQCGCDSDVDALAGLCAGACRVRFISSIITVRRSVNTVWKGLPSRALGHGFLPCTLAAFTTALGLMSLYQSDIAPIRRFGLFSALGVMATLMLLFTYLPSALQLWPPGYHRPRTAQSTTSLRKKIHDGLASDRQLGGRSSLVGQRQYLVGAGRCRNRADQAEHVHPAAEAIRPRLQDHPGLLLVGSQRRQDRPDGTDCQCGQEVPVSDDRTARDTAAGNAQRPGRRRSTSTTSWNASSWCLTSRKRWRKCLANRGRISWDGRCRRRHSRRPSSIRSIRNGFRPTNVWKRTVIVCCRRTIWPSIRTTPNCGGSACDLGALE